MAAKKNGNTGFGQYVIMGAGIAVGAAVVSVLITGMSMAVNEGVKMISSAKKTNALGAGTQYTAMPQNGMPPYQG